jgi:hypothetical protein
MDLTPRGVPIWLQIFATNDAFRGLTAPMTKRPDGLLEPNFNMRYMTEDLPHGLAVLRNIAELCNVKTPMMDTVRTPSLLSAGTFF